MILNMDVGWGRPGGLVFCDRRDGRLPENGSDMSRRGVMPEGDKDEMKGDASVCGVCGNDPVSLPMLLISLSPRASSSSRITPRTRLTMLPTTGSCGRAATSSLPTSWTLCRSLPGSEALVADTTRFKSSAVAIAHRFEPLICSRLSKLSKSKSVK
jgi:hypothetical protein